MRLLCALASINSTHKQNMILVRKFYVTVSVLFKFSKDSSYSDDDTPSSLEYDRSIAVRTDDGKNVETILIKNVVTLMPIILLFCAFHLFLLRVVSHHLLVFV